MLLTAGVEQKLTCTDTAAAPLPETLPDILLLSTLKAATSRSPRSSWPGSTSSLAGPLSTVRSRQRLADSTSSSHCSTTACRSTRQSYPWDQWSYSRRRTDSSCPRVCFSRETSTQTTNSSTLKHIAADPWRRNQAEAKTFCGSEAKGFRAYCINCRLGLIVTVTKEFISNSVFRSKLKQQKHYFRRKNYNQSLLLKRST